MKGFGLAVRFQPRAECDPPDCDLMASDEAFGLVYRVQRKAHAKVLAGD